MSRHKPGRSAKASLVFDPFVNEALASYIRSLRAARYSLRTIAAIESSTPDFLRFSEGKRVRELGIDHFEAYFLHLQERKARNGHGLISPRTQLDYRGILARWWDWMVERQYADSNPVRLIRNIRQDDNLVPTYSPEALQALAELVDPRRYKTIGDRVHAIRNQALIAILIDTPARLSEVLNLTVDDIDLDAGLIRVVGKGRKERLMLFGDSTAEALQQWISVRDWLVKGAHAYLWVKAGRGPGDPGKPLSREGLYQTIRRITKRAGIPGGRVHRFRHTFAIGWLAAGEEEAMLRVLMGVRDIPRTYLRTLSIQHAVEPYRRVSPMDTLKARKPRRKPPSGR